MINNQSYSTEEFLNQSKSRFPWEAILFSASFMLTFFAGIIVCKCLWPSVRYEREIPICLVAHKPEHAEEKKEMLPPERIFIKELPEKCLGVLEIKDNEALTVLKKKAAIGSKNAFEYLKSSTSYRTICYHCLDEGFGMVAFDDENFFILRWYEGATKPPLHLKSFYVAKGRRIEIGDAP